MMGLWAACRNTSVRRTTGTAPDAMMSVSTWPGPTEGSWSMSPTIKRAARYGTAFMSDCISMTSTMEAQAWGHHSRRHTDRSAENCDADTYSRYKGRSYRTLEISLSG